MDDLVNLLYRLRLTKQCPVDFDALYDECVFQLDTTDWKQHNLMQCYNSSPFGKGADACHFMVDEDVVWGICNDKVAVPISPRTIRVSPELEQYPLLKQWIKEAWRLDGKIDRLLMTIDVNMSNLRSWRQVNRHWRDFANTLLACMSQPEAADWVLRVVDTNRNKGKWGMSDKTVNSAARERLCTPKARDQAISALQAGLLLPDECIKGWIGYANMDVTKGW